uniref:Rtf2 domain-containing protein n=1 Tax=Macrostomum lignano TaxID=282301 RepID=A0A1I8FPT7_9PLAT
MGGDGGSIPKRIELVRSRQKPEQVAKEAELAARWRHCQLSQELLKPANSSLSSWSDEKAASSSAAGAGAAAASAASPFACPLSGVEMNGPVPFRVPLVLRLRAGRESR